MNRLHRVITLSSYLALAFAGVSMTTGCQGAGGDHASAAPATIEIRFQDSDVAEQPSSAGVLRVAPLAAAPATQAAGPTTRDEVARILVDISYADSGRPFFLNFGLTEIAPDVWRGDVPLLPRNQQLRLFARARNAAGEVAFSGETLAILTIDHQSLSIPLAPAQDNHTFQVPRMFRIVYPAEIFAGQEEQIAFTIQGNAGAAIGIRITPAEGDSPAAEFSPATGTVTLASTVADFVAVYTAPEVTADTAFDYQVTITDATAQGAVAITTDFRTIVKPRPPGAEIVTGTRPSVLFNPVILSLTANGSETPGSIELFAAVSDDGAPDQLAYQWSYAPDTSTPGATFANAGLGNPGMLEGYTVAHQGTLTLAVTDEDNGTTALHYQLAPGQFADAIDHDAVDGIRRIVAGGAHTCVVTGGGRVRCWGDNQFGQLGYGNTIDVGDSPSTLPFAAGDVPLPAADPVLQLVAGNHHTCVLLQSGFVSCWGDNRFGQLGHGHTDNLGDDEAVTAFGFVTLDELATRIAAGGDHTCAILRTGALTCWGRNDEGQLGRGNTANLGDNEPVYGAGTVDLGGATVKDLALGGGHSCALLATGDVRCWGRNDEGQLGYGHDQDLGDDEPIHTLPDVSLTGTVRKLVAGIHHTCTLTFEGTLRCWGRNTAGQLGQSYPGFAGVGVVSGNPFWGNDANELPSSLPGDVGTGAPVTDVAAGGHHTCALSSDGQLRCWGESIDGQLGYGTFNSRLTPPGAVDLDGVAAHRITAGGSHTCAVRRNGTARCWGEGADGRLGRGSTATSATATGDVDIQIFPPLAVCGDGIVDTGEQCDDGNSADGDACDRQCKISAAYLKASNTGAGDHFGMTIALSADGSTLAIGAPAEDSSATGINGQDNNNLAGSGAVYVFTRTGATWSQQAYIKASNTGANDQFGSSVALSGDGSTLVVGAPGEGSRATGVGGDQADNSLPASGAVYVFTRTGTTWSQHAYLKASNTGFLDRFGASVAISADGGTLAVGATGEASSGVQSDDSARGAGAVYVFTRTPPGWSQEAYLKASNIGAGDSFGFSIALSTDGSTLAVSAITEDSAATGIGGNQADNSAEAAGAVYVFTRSGTLWSQQAYVKASNTEAGDNFGFSVALSADGSVLAVGAPLEDSSATGVGGDQSSNVATNAGAVYMLARTGAAWTQQAYVKASNPDAGDDFGWSVALSPGGSILAVGAIAEDSAATGVGGDPSSNAATNAGAVYTFARTSAAWSPKAYVKASNAGAVDLFGHSVALSSSGTLAAGARAESSAATGVGGDPSNNAAPEAGAVYVLP